MLERARRLERVFESAEVRIANGKRLTKVFKQLAWWLRSKPRFYRTEPSRRFKLSEKRLMQLFYAWRKRGKGALVLKYRSGQPKIATSEVQKFAVACVASGISSLRQAHTTLRQPAGSMHGFRHALPTKQRIVITELLSARRRVTRLEKRARKILEAGL
jgi:hypothetical protein